MPNRPPIDPSIERTPRYDESCPPGGVADNCPQAGALRSLARKMDQLLGYFEGDGTDDRPGLKIEMDRVKQGNIDRERRIGRLENGALGLLVFVTLAVLAAVLSYVVIHKDSIRAVMGLDRDASSTLAGGWNP